MQVTIVTPVGVKFAGAAASVTAPSVNGDVGILPGHQPLMAALRTGPAVVHVPGQEPLHLVIDGGYVHVIEGDKVSIVTELCEGWPDIDPAAAKTEYDAALAILLTAVEETASATWKLKKREVDLADTRIRVAATRP
ncbi:MAG: ATP synthase F1 subunit epsilon [Myxococcales bacterium]|nr:ATP synthase F1 subunit epsilon [Myxococcales bacterium]